ncbi:MAG: hypothetical protein ACRDYX_23580 [Egibacteraceae bacterium]
MTLGLLQADAAGVAATSGRHALEACGTGAPCHCTSGNSNVIYAQALSTPLIPRGINTALLYKLWVVRGPGGRVSAGQRATDRLGSR